MSKLSLRTEGDTVVVVTRRFAAPPAEVFRAHTEPALLQQWCLGPDGWTMPVCVCDARPGGQMRYEWTNADGGGFYLTGEFLEVEAPHRIVHVERMFLPDRTPTTASRPPSRPTATARTTTISVRRSCRSRPAISTAMVARIS